MGQQSILSWLFERRTVDPTMVFKITEIAQGTKMSVGNCSRAVHRLVEAELLEEVFLVKERNYRYRINKQSYDKIKGQDQDFI